MHDIHIHTNLSSCAKPDAAYDSYCRSAVERKLQVLGFANHLWDHAVPGWSEWYAPQDIAHVSKLLDEIRNKPCPELKVYFGCETDYFGNGRVGLHRDNSGLFDYVLVPPHHFHMPAVRDPQITDQGELVKLFIERFMEVCEIDFAFGIAHPFVPLGLKDREGEILQALPEKLLCECFTAARQSNKAIELNVAGICNLHEKGALPYYKDVINIAVDCGCKFFIGSDSHTMEHFTQERYEFALGVASECKVQLPDDPLKEYVSSK